jgi:hypothetical protein
MRAIDSLVGKFDLKPRLIAGETKQAYLTAKWKSERIVTQNWPLRMPAIQLKTKMRFVTIDASVSLSLTRANSNAQNIYLSDDLCDDELIILRDRGLMTRCPDAFNAWSERNSKDDVVQRANMKIREAEARKNLIGQDIPKLQNIFLQNAIAEAYETFP